MTSKNVIAWSFNGGLFCHTCAESSGIDQDAMNPIYEDEEFMFAPSCDACLNIIDLANVLPESTQEGKGWD